MAAGYPDRRRKIASRSAFAEPGAQHRRVLRQHLRERTQPRFGVGTMAHIVQASELPDGRFALAAVGVQRFRVDRWLPDDPYPRAEIVELVEPPVEPGVHELIEPTVSALRSVYELAGRLQEMGTQSAIVVSPDPEQAAYEIAALASLGPLDAQRVLELPDTDARLRVLGELLSEHAAMLRARLDEA